MVESIDLYIYSTLLDHAFILGFAHGCFVSFKKVYCLLLGDVATFPCTVATYIGKNDASTFA